MADDIVTRLRHIAWAADEGEPYADAALDAADEIQRLRIRCFSTEDENDEMHDDLMRLLREVERLRAAGDALADALAWWGKGNDAGDAARAAWQEARRG